MSEDLYREPPEAWVWAMTRDEYDVIVHLLNVHPDGAPISIEAPGRIGRTVVLRSTP